MKPILFNTDMVRAILDGRKSVTRRAVKPQPPEGVKALYQDSRPGYWRSLGEDVWVEIRAPYQTSETLYVREAFAKMPYGYVYRADGDEPEGWDCDDRWRPSIHMPKEAARLFLRVTNVRVERLQRITLADAYAEGVEIPTRFYELWDSTIKKADLPRYGWETNPWVWVIEFERISKKEC